MCENESEPGALSSRQIQHGSQCKLLYAYLYSDPFHALVSTEVRSTYAPSECRLCRAGGGGGGDSKKGDKCDGIMMAMVYRHTYNVTTLHIEGA